LLAEALVVQPVAEVVVEQVVCWSLQEFLHQVETIQLQLVLAVVEFHHAWS
jgi:hypothetical protein